MVAGAIVSLGIIGKADINDSLIDVNIENPSEFSEGFISNF